MTMIKQRRPRGKPALFTPEHAAARYGPPLAPVILSRVPVFAPVDSRNRAPDVAIWETSWGQVEVRGGRLTQVHRRLMDAAVATHLRAELVPHPTQPPGMMLVGDPYQITHTMGTSTWDYRWLEGLLRDLRRAEVVIREKHRPIPTSVTGILADFGRYDTKRRLHSGRLSHRDDELRDMIYLTISGPWWALWADRPVAHYRDLLHGISRLKPASQAVARLCLTQADGWHITVDNALRTVGAWDTARTDTAAQRRKRWRRTIRRDAERLREIGIHLDSRDLLTYHRPPSVYVWHPD